MVNIGVYQCLQNKHVIKLNKNNLFDNYYLQFYNKYNFPEFCNRPIFKTLYSCEYKKIKLD